MNNRKWLRAGLILLTIGLTGNVLLFLLGISPFNLGSIDFRRTVESEHVTRIQISSSVGKVRIVPHLGSKIEVEMTGKAEKKWLSDYQLNVHEDNNQINIEAIERLRNRMFVINSGDYELLVKLPVRTYAYIGVSTLDASMDISDIKANELQLNSLSGRITTAQVEGKLHSETVFGDIQLRTSQIKSDLKATSNHGSVELITSYPQPGLRTQFHEGSGEKMVHIPLGDDKAAAGGPLVQLNTDTGSISIREEDN